MARLINYLEPTTGAYAPAQDMVEVQENGAMASAVHGQTKAYFPANMGAADGVVTVNGANTLRIRTIGIFYFDSSSGSNLCLAMVQSPAASAGELLPPNQMFYRSALSSDWIRADIRLTYTGSAIENDVIIVEAPPPPQFFSMNPATTRLEVWHQFPDSPLPIRKPKTLGAGQIDETLQFQNLVFPLGRALLCDGATGAASNGVPAKVRLPSTTSDPSQPFVSKTWTTVEDGTNLLSVMVESLPFVQIQPQLQNLPAAQGASASPQRSPLPNPEQTELASTGPSPFKVQSSRVQRSEFQAAAPHGFRLRRLPPAHLSAPRRQTENDR